jgi:hypothetical protein
MLFVLEHLWVTNMGRTICLSRWEYKYYYYYYYYYYLAGCTMFSHLPAPI